MPLSNRFIASRASPRDASARVAMYAVVYIAAFVATLTVPFVVVDTRRRTDADAWTFAFASHANATHGALVLFNAINVLICAWEIALWVHRERVKKLHVGFVKKFGDRVSVTARRARDGLNVLSGFGAGWIDSFWILTASSSSFVVAVSTQVLPSPLFLFSHITVREALSLEYWAIVFASYASLDPSYVQHTSWSFWVDVGNGFVTLIPTLALSIAITRWPHVDVIARASPRLLGLLAVVVNYQMLYGTVVYFANYVYNGYYRGASRACVAIVIIANIIWIAFPAMWIVIGSRAVRDGAFVPTLFP